MNNDDYNQSAQTNNQTQGGSVATIQSYNKNSSTKSRKLLLTAIISILWLSSLVGAYFLSVTLNKNSSTEVSTQDASTTKNNTNNEVDIKNNGSSSTSSDKSTPLDPNKWTTYNPSSKVYQINIPSGWMLLTPEDKDDLIMPNPNGINLNENHAGRVYQNISDKNNGFSSNSVAFYLIYDYKKNEKSYLSDKLVKEKTYATKNGIEVSKYKRVGKDDTEKSSGLGISDDTVQYTYDLVSGTKNIHIVHDILKGETDQSKVIEAMIETVNFQ